jgi:hypothetical protein
MRSRILPVVAVSAAALVAAVSFSGTAAAHPTAASHQGRATSTVGAPGAVPDAAACYSNNVGDTGNGYLSTKTKLPTGYTSTGAADFTVKKSCTIKTVAVTGVYGGGTGPAKKVTVTFYKDTKGLPGAVIAKSSPKANFSSPDFVLPLAKPVTLKKGKYFVSVQASMDYSTVGGWYWESTATVQNSIDVWENNGGAFDNCTTWASLQTCFGVQSDLMVELS